MSRATLLIRARIVQSLSHFAFFLVRKVVVFVVAFALVMVAP